MKRISKTRRKPITEIGRLRIGLSLAWLFVLLLLLFTGSCTQTEVEEDVIPPHALKDVDAGFNLNVLATRTPVTRSITFMPDGTIESDTLAVGAKDSVQTKAANPLKENQESQIASLWVGQYDATTGKRLFNQYISSMTGTTVNLKLKQSQNKSKSRVYFVSNAGDLGAIADETTLKKHTLTYASTEAGLPDNDLCKMMGMWEDEIVAGGVKEVTVNLTRLLAKITFTYSMGEGFTFTPTVVQLKNAPSLSQIEAPAAQLTTDDISYRNYTGTANEKGATVYWYLPENMAGTVTGEYAVNSEKKKIGTGVKNATCIELTGDAVQGGVTYRDVTFRFYPGSDKNNYDIQRNAHYTMDVKLVGIDVSDERITVGEIPDIEVDPTEMPAKKGGEKEIQITARPGQEWMFNMPQWLSAFLDGKTIPSGATITHQGPAKVVFQAVEANPKAEKREVSFKINVNGTDQNIKITQTGSTLAKGSDISLAALANSEGSSSFTATEGLQWSAVLNGGDGWLSWASTNPGVSGAEAPAGAQALKVKTTASNPSAQERSGKIVVKAGASVGDAAYTGLKQEIAVKQAGSTVSGSTVTVNAEAAGAQSSFTATAGLDWALSVANGSWITLAGSTSGSPTTGNAQNVSFNVAVNPSSSQRTNDITVRAGDVSNGPTNKITVTQKGAALSVSGANTVAATASTNDYTSTFSATKGLSWNVSESMDWLTLKGATSGANNTTGENQDIKYSVVVNPNASAHKGNITVKAGNAVSGTDAGLTKTIMVTQEASSLMASGTTPLGAVKESSGTLRFTGTKGLGITITPPSWITLTATAPATTTGSEQTVGYKANATNPDAAERAAANITVKAGNITKPVAVNQSASSLTASATSPLAATMDAIGTFTMNGTKDLAYSFTAGFPSWLSVSNGTAYISGGTTTGGSQTLTYKTKSVNPNASERSATVTVKAGNISRSVTIKQSASSFSRTNPMSNIAAAANSTTTGSITATAGLAWTISPTTSNGITVSPTNGAGNRSLTFTGTGNTGAARTGTFTISVTGASPARTATITATQTAGVTNQVTINSTVVASYKAKTTDYARFPPFNYDGGASSGTLGSDRNGVSYTCTLSKTYSIEVEKTERGSYSNHAAAVSYCKSKGSGWRVPTIIELKAMYDNWATLQNNGCAPIIRSFYWSSSVYNGNSGYRSILNFINGNFDNEMTVNKKYVRCVRDI